MLTIDSLPGRTVQAEGREFLYCGGTSYLGMARNEDFATLLAEGMRRYGTNYASSRLSNVQLRVFEEAESHLAAYAGAEAALTVSSGYLAGQMVVKTWQG
ncbi:MAG: class I and II aminotransferase, partial [Ferruginibacter sp.]|nr:class I and II aminotransferase [Cytophagales bacterium]